MAAWLVQYFFVTNIHSCVKGYFPFSTETANRVAAPLEFNYICNESFFALRMAGRDQETDDPHERQVVQEGGAGQLEADPDVHGRPQGEGATNTHRTRGGHQGLDTTGAQGRDLHPVVQTDDGQQARVSRKNGDKSERRLTRFCY